MNRSIQKSASSMPSLTTWLVVFLILFILVMVLVFSQYRKKVMKKNGGLSELLLGNAGASLFDWIQNEEIPAKPIQSVRPFPPSVGTPRQPINLTPKTPQGERKLRPVQGYGFALADQLMVLE